MQIKRKKKNYFFSFTFPKSNSSTWLSASLIDVFDGGGGAAAADDDVSVVDESCCKRNCWAKLAGPEEVSALCRNPIFNKQKNWKLFTFDY